MSLRTSAQGAHDVHAPDLERGAGLHTGAVDILLFRALLALHLAGVALLQHSMHFRDQPKHVDPLSAEMGCSGDACVSQKLMSGLNDSMAYGMWNVKALTGSPFFQGLEAPKAGGGILMQRG